MANGLLQNIFYGNELDDDALILSWPALAFPELNESERSRLLAGVKCFFSDVKPGVFGGPITAGDATVLAAVMEYVRPVQMIEIGVASGWSSSFILSYADRAGLLDDGIFLHSFDLRKEYSPEKVIGNYLYTHHVELGRHWSLNTEITSETLLRRRFTPEYRTDGPIVAFVDGGHVHPWPLLDLIYLQRALPHGSWVVLQDSQMMERWIADCVIYDVPSPAPVRGVNLAVSHWPGSKIFGTQLAYNSAAIRLDVSDEQMRLFIQAMRRYPFETDFDPVELLT